MAATEPQFLQLLSPRHNGIGCWPQMGADMCSPKNLTEPALEANEGCWINVREGSVTLLSRHWQLAAPPRPILLNHPTLIWTLGQGKEAKWTKPCKGQFWGSHPTLSWTPCGSAFPSMGQAKWTKPLKRWGSLLVSLFPPKCWQSKPFSGEDAMTKFSRGCNDKRNGNRRDDTGQIWPQWVKGLDDKAN